MAIAALAALDALRGGEDAGPEPPADTAPAEVTPPLEGPSPHVLRRVREEGLAGVLDVVDLECRLRIVLLPGLEEVPAGESRTCALRHGGSLRAFRGPLGAVGAQCRDGTIEIARRGVVVRDVEGCTPAWRPDGSLAFVRGLAVLGLDPGCRGGDAACVSTLLSREDLAQAGVAGAAVVDHAWLSSTRAAVLLAWPAGGHVLGIFEGRRLVATHRWGGGEPGRLEVAPGGGLFTARPARVFRADGAPVTLAPRFRNARALEWSPDGGWAALAMGGAIVLVPTTGLVGGVEARRAIRLPFPARDLAWRAG